MIFSNQRASEKHKFVLVGNQYLSEINIGKLPVYQIGALTELINALYENNLWQKCIAVYPFVGNTLDKNSLNLIDPFKYKISWSGSITSNNFGVTGNGGTGFTNIPLKMLLDFNNVHLSVYVRTSIFNTVGAGRLIGVNTKINQLAIKDRGALEINFNKESGIVGFVYNILNNGGGFGKTYAQMQEENFTGQGFFIANNNSVIKDAKCYLNGDIFGSQFPLLPTEIHPQNNKKLTIFGNGYDNILNTNPLRANISFISIGYGLTQDQIFNFNKIMQTFQTAMQRSVL
jgi:hypothetical protein